MTQAQLFGPPVRRTVRIPTHTIPLPMYVAQSPVELSIEDVRALHAVLTEAIAQHQPWPAEET